MSDPAKPAADRLQASLGAKVLKTYADDRGVVVEVALEALTEALAALKQDEQTPFNLLSDATAVDWLTWAEETGFTRPEKRFTVYYNLYSIAAKARIFVEAHVSEDEEVPSAAALYHSANWAEREVYDMFGIRFAGHPDLRRILMPLDYEHFPLRKDFPRRGPEPQDFPQE